MTLKALMKFMTLHGTGSQEVDSFGHSRNTLFLRNWKIMNCVQKNLSGHFFPSPFHPVPTHSI
jgi:hypothetical protein